MTIARFIRNARRSLPFYLLLGVVTAILLFPVLLGFYHFTQIGCGDLRFYGQFLGAETSRLEQLRHLI